MDRSLDSVPTGEFFSVPEITDPTTFTDEELVRAYRKRAGELWQAVNEEVEHAWRKSLARLRPEQLPGTFLTLGAFSPEGWQTDHGSWVPVPKKAVSSVGNMLAVKTTLEFKPNKGTKVVDIGEMAIYNCLVPRAAGGLIIDESSALCCVFPKGKGPATDPCKGFVAPRLGEWQEEIRVNFDATKCCPIGVEDYGVGGKRKRGSGWEGYTKIYTIDDELVYAACNHCTTMLKLKANSGTGSQTKHKNSCLFKKQLSIGNSMDTPSIASGASTQDTSTA